MEGLKHGTRRAAGLFSVALVVGLLAGTLTADFVRFGRSPKVIVTMTAFFLDSLMFIFGAAGGAVTGYADVPM